MSVHHIKAKTLSKHIFKKLIVISGIIRKEYTWYMSCHVTGHNYTIYINSMAYFFKHLELRLIAIIGIIKYVNDCYRYIVPQLFKCQCLFRKEYTCILLRVRFIPRWQKQDIHYLFFNLLQNILNISTPIKIACSIFSHRFSSFLIINSI